LKLKQQDFAHQQGIRLHGELTDRKGSEGICHSIVLESYALPAAEYWLGLAHRMWRDRMYRVRYRHDDVFNSWITKDVRVKVPESVKIVIRGKKHPTSRPRTSSSRF